MRTRTEKRTRLQKGFSLIETAIALLIAGLIMAAVWVAGQKAMQNYRIYRTTQQIGTVVQNMRDFFANTQNFSSAWGGTTPQVMAKLDGLGIFPADMRRDPTLALGDSNVRIDHAMFNVKYYGSGSGATGAFVIDPQVNDDYFRVRIKNLDIPECMQMLLRIPIMDGEMGIRRIGTSNMGNNWSEPFSVAVDATTARNWCSNTQGDNEVDIEFYLRS